MKLLFLAFCYIATRGRGLLCFAPQLDGHKLANATTAAADQDHTAVTSCDCDDVTEKKTIIVGVLDTRPTVVSFQCKRRSKR